MKDFSLLVNLKQLNDLIGNSKPDNSVKFQYNCVLPFKYGVGWYLTENGFYKREIINIVPKDSEKGDREKHYHDKLISPIVIIPKRILDINENEELEIYALYKYEEFKIIVSIIETDSFSSVTKFKTFLKSLFKLSWFDGDIFDVTEYEKYLQKYSKYYQIKIKKAVCQLGWDNTTEELKFHPYSSETIFIKDQPELKMLESCFHSKGSLESWKSIINILKKNIIFNFILAASISSAVISLFNRQSFWLHLYDKYSQGKTPSFLAAASIWGFPGDGTRAGLVRGFNVTPSGLEYLCSFNRNLPIFLDDSSNMNNKLLSSIDSLIYLAVNGVGKNRGTLKGGIQHYHTWKNVIFSNGEDSLLNNKKVSNEGVVKRCIELNGSPFENISDASKCYDFFNNNYGFAGPIIINALIKNKDNLYETLINFDIIFNHSDFNVNIESHKKILSIVAFSDYLFERLLNKVSPDKAFHNACIMGTNISKILTNEQSINRFNTGLTLLKEYINSHRIRFKKDCLMGQVGFIEDEEVYFFHNELKNLLNEWNIPCERFLKELKKNNLVYIDNNNNFKQKKYNGQNSRPICFKREFIRIENDNDSLEDLYKKIERAGMKIS